MIKAKDNNLARYKNIFLIRQHVVIANQIFDKTNTLNSTQ